MIGIDWGTSSFRAFRFAPDGTVAERVETAQGIMHTQDFPNVLRDAIRHWTGPVLMSGMIGSRQGWVEAAYLPCPTDAEGLAAALVRVPGEAEIWIVPGLTCLDTGGMPEVMRGEETQIVGAAAEGLVCLPGSHAKWARVVQGRITSFRTYFSGEAFAAMRNATILGRMMNDAPTDLPAFDRGLARAEDEGHLLNHLFGVRSLGLFNRLGADESGSYLSGLLIGHEVRAALRRGSSVHLIGAAPLCALYARAIARCGGTPVIEDSEAAARGLHSIGATAPWR